MTQRHNVGPIAALLAIGLYLNSLLVASAQSAASNPLSDVTVTTAATLVCPNNSFRDACSCTNQSTTINVRWGSSAVTTAKGQRIPAGATAEIRNKGPIYMIAESSTAVVSCTEETR